MDLNITHDEKLKKIYKVKVAPGILEKEQDRICTELTAKADIPGFRKNKFSDQKKLRVKTLYDYQIKTDSMYSFIDKALKELQDKYPNIFKEPSLDNMKTENGLEFDLTFELLPELPSSFDFKNIEITKPLVEIEDEVVNNQIDVLLKSWRDKTLKLPEESIEEGDILGLSLILKEDEKENRHPFQLELIFNQNNDSQKPELADEIKKKFIGQKIGCIIDNIENSSKDFILQLGITEEELSKLHISIEVMSVHKLGPVLELTTELLTKKNFTPDIEKFKELIKQSKIANFEQRIEDIMGEELYKKLVDNLSDLEIPETISQEIENNSKSNEDDKQKKEEKIINTFYIMHMRKNNLQVTENDLFKQAIKMMNNFGQNDLQKFMEIIRKNKVLFDRLQSNALNDMIIENLLKLVNIKEVKMTSKEFEEKYKK